MGRARSTPSLYIAQKRRNDGGNDVNGGVLALGVVGSRFGIRLVGDAVPQFLGHGRLILFAPSPPVPIPLAISISIAIPFTSTMLLLLLLRLLLIFIVRVGFL